MLLAACTGIVAGGASAREGAIWGVADRQRAERLVENIEICRRLWSEDGVTFKGKFRSFEGITVQPRPVQRPCPIWIASNPSPAALKPAMLDRALQRVARLADGWMTVQLFPGALKANWTKIAESLRQEGRDPAVFPTMAYHNVNLNPDRQAALAETKRFLDEYYGPVFSPPMVESWTAAGTPEQCVEHLRALMRDGARTITLRITSWQQEEQFKRLVGEVSRASPRPDRRMLTAPSTDDRAGLRPIALQRGQHVAGIEIQLSMPRLVRQKSRGGNCTGATAPSRNSRSSGEVFNNAWAPPRVMAVRVIRVTASPTKYLARYKADKVAGLGPWVSLSQAE